MMIHKAQSGKTYDTAIIGGGILGLWAARHAIKRGERVALFEKRSVGAGASGGFLGALMPHMPDRWNDKKQFQFEGLHSLEAVIAELEAESGVDCGYRRCGRIMPVTNEKLLQQIEKRIAGASNYWQGQYEMALIPPSLAPENAGDHELFRKGWINPDIAEFGVQHDTLSARVNPRAYLKALETYVRPLCDFFIETAVETLEVCNGEVSIVTQDKVHITAERVCVASGYEAYQLLQPFIEEANSGKPIGRGVKGQAVLVEFEHDDNLPIVYHDGSYVVPHKRNLVAIGSTSQNDWDDPDAFDEGNMEFYERALELVPALKNAPIIDRWASVRPRNTLEGRGTEPYFGQVGHHENLFALIGGFKITLGISHLSKPYII